MLSPLPPPYQLGATNQMHGARTTHRVLSLPPSPLLTPPPLLPDTPNLPPPNIPQTPHALPQTPSFPLCPRLGRLSFDELNGHGGQGFLGAGFEGFVGFGVDEEGGFGGSGAFEDLWRVSVSEQHARRGEEDGVGAGWRR